MYITCNNGGLSVHNHSGINGTDIQTQYANGLRGYSKETVTYGHNRSPVGVRIADHIMKTSLKTEDPYFSEKYGKKLAKMLQKQNFEELDPIKKHRRQNTTINVPSDPTGSAKGYDIGQIKEILASNPGTLTKADIYFRNQDRLMSNAVIPEFEKRKMADKMKF